MSKKDRKNKQTKAFSKNYQNSIETKKKIQTRRDLAT